MFKKNLCFNKKEMVQRTDINDYRKLKTPAIFLIIIIISYTTAYAVMYIQLEKPIKESDRKDTNQTTTVVPGSSDSDFYLDLSGLGEALGEAFKFIFDLGIITITLHIVLIIFAMVLWSKRTGPDTLSNVMSFIFALLFPQLYIIYVFIRGFMNYLNAKPVGIERQTHNRIVSSKIVSVRKPLSSISLSSRKSSKSKKISRKPIMSKVVSSPPKKAFSI